MRNFQVIVNCLYCELRTIPLRTTFMDLIKQLLDLVLHLDKHLDVLVQSYQGWTYAILFLIIFCETGLVVMPFLPGDSLLFALGALSASGSLNVVLLRSEEHTSELQSQ